MALYRGHQVSEYQFLMCFSRMGHTLSPSRGNRMETSCPGRSHGPPSLLSVSAQLERTTDAVEGSGDPPGRSRKSSAVRQQGHQALDSCVILACLSLSRSVSRVVSAWICSCSLASRSPRQRCQVPVPGHRVKTRAYRERHPLSLLSGDSFRDLAESGCKMCSTYSGIDPG